MPQAKPKLTLLLLGIYILTPTVLLLGLTLYGLRRIPDSSQLENDRLIPIYNTQPLMQEISPVNNGISTMLIYLKNARLLNTDPFIFTLRDSNSNEVRRIELSGRNIGDGDNIRFQFLPILDSAGKKYSLTLQAPYTNFDGPKIEAGVSSSDPADLSYELFYHPTNKMKTLTDLFVAIQNKIYNPKLIILLGSSFIIFHLSLSRILKNLVSK